MPISPPLEDVGVHVIGDAGPADEDDNHQEHQRQVRHHGVDPDLRMRGLHDGDHLGVGQQTIDLVHQAPGILVAAPDDFDGVDDGPLFGQGLHGVQVGENAGIIHRARLRQHGDDVELLAEDLDGIGFLEPERGGDIGPHEGFVALQRLDDFLRESVLLSLDSIMPTPLPQPMGCENIPAPPQDFFA